MTIDKAQLKALAEAFPTDLDFDHNTEPFFNGPSGESLGGGSTGFFSVYGQPFEIDGELYDGTEYVSICTREFAEFVCSARSGVLGLLAEIERLERKNSNQSESIREYQALTMGGDVSLGMLKADIRVATGERDHLKSELAGLRTGYDAQNNLIAGLKAENEELEKAAMSYGEDLQWHTYELESVKAERDVLIQDANRYRWLRKQQMPLEGHDFLSTQEILDRRVDAAMAKEASHG